MLNKIPSLLLIFNLIAMFNNLYNSHNNSLLVLQVTSLPKFQLQIKQILHFQIHNSRLMHKHQWYLVIYNNKINNRFYNLLYREIINNSSI